MQTSLTHTGASAHLIVLKLLICFYFHRCVQRFRFLLWSSPFSQFIFSLAGFCGARVASRPVRSTRASVRGPVRVSAAGGYQWLNKEPLALVIGFAGYVLDI